ncbi:unnamed protein product [Schistosoma bovis]|nr:unnamed protein product [Schistosoma bovis]
MPLTSTESLSLITLDSSKSSNLCISVNIPSLTKESIKLSSCNISPTFNIDDILSTHYEQDELNKQTLNVNKNYPIVQMNETDHTFLNNDSFTKPAISMEVQCISKNEIKSNGWSTKTCHYPYSNSHSINHDCNLEQETSQYKLMNTNDIHQNNNDISTMLTNHSYLKSNLLPINDSCIFNEISPTRNTDNSNNNNKNGDDDGDVDADQYLPSIMNKQKSLFVSIGIQTDDHLISKCCNKEILSNDNLSNISYFCDKNDTNTTHDNNSNNNNIMWKV